MKIIKGYTVTESIILYTEHITVNMMYIYKYIISLLNAVIYPFKKLYKLCKRIRNITYHLYHRLKLKIKRYYKEILLVIVFIVGHFLLTWGIADMFGDTIWKLSYGLLFVGIGGFKYIFKFLVNGFYTMSEKSNQYGDY